MWRHLGRVVQKPELVFLTLASVFGVFSAFVVPQLSVPDENMHFLRSYTISTGHIVGDRTNKCVFPKEIYNRAYSIYKGDYAPHFSQKIDFNTTQIEWCGTASSYSPLIYIPQAIGFFIARVVWPSTGLMILLGRLASLALFIGVTYYIIKKVRVGKWVYVVVALFPTVIQQVASLSADSFTYVAMFAAVAFLLNRAIQKTAMTKWQFTWLLLLSGALILSKIPDVVIILFILFLPTRLFVYKFKKKVFLLKPIAMKLYTLLAAGIFALLLAYIWQVIYGQPLVATAGANPIPSHPWQFLPILFHTYVYMDPKSTLFGFTGLGGFGDFILSSAVGGFASYRYWLPEILIFACYLLLILALLRPNAAEDKIFGDNSGKLALGSVVVLSVLVAGISYSLYVIWALPLLGSKAMYAAGLQGRYFTDAFVLLIPIGLWLRNYIRIVVKSDMLYSGTVASMSCFILLFYALQTLYAIHLGFFH